MRFLAEMPVPVRVGVDAHLPYLEQRPSGPLVPIILDARDATRIFPASSFDLVTMIDFLEHLDRDDAERVLLIAETLARKRVIVFTPRGSFPQDHDVTGLGGDEWQRHRSEWQPTDFTAAGYHVAVLRGFHGPGNASFDAAFPSGSPSVDALLAWKDVTAS